jgi:hypothetical protein
MRANLMSDEELDLAIADCEHSIAVQESLIKTHTGKVAKKYREGQASRKRHLKNLKAEKKTRKKSGVEA